MHRTLFSVLSALVLIGCGGNRTIEILTPTGDSDIYGVVTDSHGNRIEGVVVSDGYSCTITDKNGEYQLSSCEYSYHVFISIPEDYEVPLSDGLPCFWQRLEKDTERYDFTINPLKRGMETEFNLVCIADPQVRSRSQITRFKGETVPDITALAAASNIPCYGVILGDICFNKQDWDVSPIFPVMREEIGKCAVPFFAVMGNHDNTRVGVPSYTIENDIEAQRYYESIYGPANFSFNRGNAHVICMDDVLFNDHVNYELGFRDDQIEWLRQDLEYVAPDKSLILCVHIPLEENLKGPNVQNLIGMLEKHAKYFHVMSGHLHSQSNIIHNTYYEHNQSAAMGTYWTCDICCDGNPNGYIVYRVDTSGVAEWRFKPTLGDADFQLRMYRGKDVFYPNFSPKYQFPYNDDGDIIANVFNADPNWKVEVYENGEYSGEMERFIGRDAWASGFLEGFRHEVGISTVPHLYHYTLRDVSAEVEVRATDPFGNVFTCSTFTTNQLEDCPL